MSSSPVAKPLSLGISLRPADLWRMFKERWWIGLIVGILAGSLSYYLQPTRLPVYRTEVTLLFESRKDRVLNIREVVDTSLQNAAELNTHMETLRSKSFLDYVFVSFTPEETAKIQEAYRDPENPTAPPPSLPSIVGSNLSIYNRRGTTILALAVVNRSPECAALIANRIARKYIDFNLDRANTGTNTAIVFLRNQADDMRRQVEAAERALQAFRSKHNLAVIGESQNVVVQKLGSLGSTLVANQLEQVKIKAALENVERYKASQRPLSELPEILSYPQVAKGRAELDRLASQRTLLSEKYLRRHPLMKQNEAETAEAKRMLEEGVERAVSDLETRFEIAAKYELKLRSELADAEILARELESTLGEGKFLQQEADTKRSAYVNITNRLNETSITSQMENVSIRIFDNAWIPSSPTSDHVGPRAATAGGITLILLFLTPLVFGLLDSRIATTAQVEGTLGEHLLGTLPRIKKLNESERSQAFLGNRDDRVVEAYRGLYGEIEIGSTIAYPKSILITSSIPGEGKSLVASNLAATFASHGRRTLLVDCDLRRPTLYRYFGISGEPGWVQWLSAPGKERSPFPEGIVNVAPGFDVLPAGGAPKNSTQIIEQLAKVETQKSLLAAYDLIIFDTPPTTVFPDALLLARSCHELIYICRHRLVRLGVVRRALAHLRGTGVRALGVILNHMPDSADMASGYYGYGTRAAKYYKAYAERQPEKE